MRSEAAARGIREETLALALSGVEPLPVVVERDQQQPEFKLSLDAYLKRRLTKATVRTARAQHDRHRALLRRIQRAYGVDPATLVAVWGLESNFGRFSGVRPTIATLATLVYEPRRSQYFREELFQALAILDWGDIDVARMRGSWAGAMGQPQFMPSSYTRFAVDFDGDGRRDIWSSPPDVFASIANFLKAHGWVPGVRWGREVRVPRAAEARLDSAVSPRTSGVVRCSTSASRCRVDLAHDWRHAERGQGDSRLAADRIAVARRHARLPAVRELRSAAR